MPAVGGGGRGGVGDMAGVGVGGPGELGTLVRNFHR
jgi:hypothetical protein